MPERQRVPQPTETSIKLKYRTLLQEQEGYLTERLLRVFDEATVTAIVQNKWYLYLTLDLWHRGIEPLTQELEELNSTRRAKPQRRRKV